MKQQLRVTIFNAVRDIPYRISSQEQDASCVAKTKLLGELLTRAGLTCKVMACDVKWSDTGISSELLQLAPRPTFVHFFLSVLIPETGQWIMVDATWDSAMASRFFINQWDGVTDTPLAYPGVNVREATDKTGATFTSFSFLFRDFDERDEFTRKLNRWYANARRLK